MTSAARPCGASSANQKAFLPVPVADLELTTPETSPEPNTEGQIFLLVRLHGVPVGTLLVSRVVRAQTAGTLHDLAADRFAAEISRHLEQDRRAAESAPAGMAPRVCSFSTPEVTDLISVIVCTLGEDPRLLATVESVLTQSHRNLELIVVDNSPSSGKVRAALNVVTDARLRVVSEPRRGLSVARNTGLSAALGSVVAYTDDDAFAEPDWVREVVAPFSESPNITCVTGLVLPAELATQAQLFFEEFGAFDKGFERTIWRIGPDSDTVEELGTPGRGGTLFPYSPGVYGSGNNMAFRTEWLRANGGFDVALGAGTLARGGEDLDAFLNVVLSGCIVVYEPRAIVRHYARSDMDGLERQMYGYGSGLGAVMIKHLVGSPRGALAIGARLPAGLRKLLDPTSEKNESKSGQFPVQLTRAERIGLVSAPALYLRSRRDAKRRGLRDAPSVHPPGQ